MTLNKTNISSREHTFFSFLHQSNNPTPCLHLPSLLAGSAQEQPARTRPAGRISDYSKINGYFPHAIIVISTEL